MNPSVALPGSMTRMGIRLSSGSRRPQSPKGLPLHLLNRFSVSTASDAELKFFYEFGPPLDERIGQERCSQFLEFARNKRNLTSGRGPRPFRCDAQRATLR